MCDSLLCTLAVAVSVVVAVIVYRKNLRQLLKILFVGFVLFGAFVSTRHLFYRAARWLKCFLWRRRSREEECEPEGKTPSLVPSPFPPPVFHRFQYEIRRGKPSLPPPYFILKYCMAVGTSYKTPVCADLA